MVNSYTIHNILPLTRDGQFIAEIVHQGNQITGVLIGEVTIV